MATKISSKMSRHASGTLAFVLALSAAAALAIPQPADARITRIEISRVESPTFQGTVFGSVGMYEKIVGRAFGEVDPRSLQDRKVVDVELAPRNAGGRVEYANDFMILRPLDPSRGNGRLFYELTNRGTVLSLAVLNGAPIQNDPSAAAHAGNGFLMREGYTILLSGWDATVPPGGGRFTTSVPVATQSDGTPIVGPALEELVIDNATTLQGVLTYPTADLDPANATLTVRAHQADPPVVIPASGWAFASPTAIRLLPSGTPFTQGMLYELRYDATAPLVAGLAFPAVRDLASFFARAAVDDAGHANPLAGQIERVYGFAVSQPARFLRDFVDLGFNFAGHDEVAFDGILNWIAGPSGGFFNFRFAQPARTHRQRIGRNYPEREFPFSYRLEFDLVTHKLDGRRISCFVTHSCPLILEANSANEYWVKGGSLLHTDPQGHDAFDAQDVRSYLISSLPHQGATGPGICQQDRNPLGGGPALRALQVALDEWATSGRRPPASRVPHRLDGTLVPSLPQSRVGFPQIPGVTYNGLMTTGDLLFFGPNFKDGVLTVLPPLRAPVPPYPVFVPATDADGNDRAGVRLPEIEVPLATYTGWAVRAAAFGGDDLCDQFGQRIPFARTSAERLAASDPRLSIEERYASHEDYVARVTRAAQQLAEQRLLLDEDVSAYIQAAESSDVRR